MYNIPTKQTRKPLLKTYQQNKQKPLSKMYKKKPETVMQNVPAK